MVQRFACRKILLCRLETTACFPCYYQTRLLQKIFLHLRLFRVLFFVFVIVFFACTIGLWASWLQVSGKRDVLRIETCGRFFQSRTVWSLLLFDAGVVLGSRESGTGKLCHSFQPPPPFSIRGSASSARSRKRSTGSRTTHG
jgi:hypothetical protein